MISQTQYDNEMNRRKGLAEFCRRVNSSNTQTATAPTLDQTSSNNTVPSVSNSTTEPTIDSVIARTPRISNSPSKIVKNLTMKNSKIGEKVLLKIAYAFFHEKSLTQAKTSFQKETLTNFEKHILVGFVLDRDYLSAYQYFRSFFTVDRRSIFTSEDIHDIRTISSILLEAHFCASVTR